MHADSGARVAAITIGKYVMNEPNGAAGLKLTSGFVTRTDLKTAAIVDEGLTMLHTCGLECAAVFLSSQMVPLAVARRALLVPPERRTVSLERKRV
jgi:hypothetical protein